MKNLFLIVLTILLTFSANAQNIIANSNFALYANCLPPGYGYIDSCTGWHKASFGTSDYLNSCTSGAFDVPQSAFGYQASSDDAYAGVLTMVADSFTVRDYKEYITTGFTPLEVGSTYRATIVVSLSDSSFYATDGLGMYFSVGSRFYNTLVTIPVVPQVDFTSYGIINDKVNWVKLTANFTADSAYDHVTIGCFKDTAHTLFSVCAFHGSSMSLDSIAYYYIDSVAVERLVPAIANNLNSDIPTSLYPNPMKGEATLHFATMPRAPFTIKIYSVQGILVREMANLFSQDVKLPKENLETGFYYYDVRDASSTIARGKMIIE